MPPISVRLTKRALDVVASSVGLGLTLPFYPLIAAAIRYDSSGPVFFGQIRAKGLIPREPGDTNPVPQCTEFKLFKFRTMRQDAEKHTGAVMAAENDPRITRLGAFLRKSRIDELPQLWNVLRGDMSLVGPRPERPELLVNLALAIPYFEERMRDCKPGLTGLAQVSLGYTGAIPEGSALSAFREALQNPFKLEEAEGALADDLRAKLLFDLAYTAALESFSTYLPTELSVIFKTPLVMLKAMGR
ncbi:MAG: sugar transferase [Polyangiaceae bacterium]|nr:sugar transferase [Myxococcales bacterium]MCB9587368.1 sugar transferase [Polyangiaceae bacterium]MCB9605835.1 sugar transferase [Polyangiaceae bacterium]